MSSSWKLEEKKRFPKLAQDESADVVVVGGGLAGVWCAYLLAKEGKKVVVLEKKHIGSGQTEYTTAFITQAIDTPLFRLERMFGRTATREIWQSGRVAIDLIEKVIKDEGIDCEWKRLPIHTYAQSWREYQDLQREYNLARELGFEHLTLSYRFNPGFRTKGALLIANQAKYHPLKFLYGLRDAAEKLGVKFFEETEVTEISGSSPVAVLTKTDHLVEAENAIIATYMPFGNPKITHFKKAMYVSYVYELKIKKGAILEGMYLDMHNPYHYTRVDDIGGTHDRMIVGGEDHRAELPGLEEKSYKALRKYIDETFRGLDYEVVQKWKGGILEPSDGLPLIGEVAKGQYVACAFSGNGMTYAPISAMILAGSITGKESEFAEVYDTKRDVESIAVLNKLIDYTQEFFGGAVKNFFRR